MNNVTVAVIKIDKIDVSNNPRGKKQSTSDSGAGTGPKTLAERRMGLLRKRWSFVNAELVKLLSGDWDVTQLRHEDKVTAVMYLVSCFGVKTFAANKIEDINDAMSSKTVQSAMTSKLFDMMEHCFVYDIEWKGPITQIPDEYINVTKIVADLFCIELTEMSAESERVYPEPKSWANLKADGTPKVKK
jgi:hypothetical protein